MDNIELIIEAMNNEEQERKIAAVARVKYRLPSVGLYVVETTAANLAQLRGIEGVNGISGNMHVTAQVVGRE